MPPTTKMIRRDSAPRTPMNTRSRVPMVEVPPFFHNASSLPFWFKAYKFDEASLVLNPSIAVRIEATQALRLPGE